MTAPGSGDAVALEALIASRLCHDLINPIGAIGNGLELLQTTLPSSPELEMVTDSTRLAMDRVRFFRIAFGAASADETIEERLVLDLLGGLYSEGRLKVSWDGLALSRPETRLLFLAILCAESALPLGGVLRIRHEGRALYLNAEARRHRLDSAAWAHLTDGAPFFECRSAEVHFLLARRRLCEAGLHVSLIPRENGFDFDILPR